MTERERFINYLKGIGCEIKVACMKREIEQFGYFTTEEVIAIDGHVMFVRQFDELATDWCKYIEPHISENKR